MRHCKTGYDISGSPETFEDVRQLARARAKATRSTRPNGCEHCHFEGFSGRTGVAEVLRVDKEIRQMILEKRSRSGDPPGGAWPKGMLDLRRAALLKVAQGITSTEEVVRVIPAESLLPDG